MISFLFVNFKTNLNGKLDENPIFKFTQVTRQVFVIVDNAFKDVVEALCFFVARKGGRERKRMRYFECENQSQKGNE